MHATAYLQPACHAVSQNLLRFQIHFGSPRIMKSCTSSASEASPMAAKACRQCRRAGALPSRSACARPSDNSCCSLAAPARIRGSSCCTNGRSCRHNLCESAQASQSHERQRQTASRRALDSEDIAGGSQGLSLGNNLGADPHARHVKVASLQCAGMATPAGHVWLLGGGYRHAAMSRQ